MVMKPSRSERESKTDTHIYVSTSKETKMEADPHPMKHRASPQFSSSLRAPESSDRYAFRLLQNPIYFAWELNTFDFAMSSVGIRDLYRDSGHNSI